MFANFSADLLVTREDAINANPLVDVHNNMGKRDQII
jgi:hypothetical protein